MATPVFSQKFIDKEGKEWTNPGERDRSNQRIDAAAAGETYTDPYAHLAEATQAAGAIPATPREQSKKDAWYVKGLDIIDPLGVSGDLARAASAGGSFGDKALNVGNAAGQGFLRGPLGKPLDALGAGAFQDFINPGGEGLAAAADEITDRKTGDSGLDSRGDPIFGLGRDNPGGPTADNRVFDRAAELGRGAYDAAGNLISNVGDALGGTLGGAALSEGDRASLGYGAGINPELRALNDAQAAGANQAAQEARSASERLRALGTGAAQAGAAAAAGFSGQSAAAQNRAAPQIAENQARLQQQGDAVANLQSFQAGGGAEQSALSGFQAGGGQDVQSLRGFQADNAGVGNLEAHRADTSGIAALQNFQAGREGVGNLNTFAEGPAGPSAAEAMLRLQSVRDQGQALALARSARGGAGAVANAMKQAQGENAFQASQTRGQMALVQADEAAKHRQESLAALTSAAQVGSTQDRTDLGALQSASGDLLAGSAQNLAATRAASQDRLAASGQQLSAQQAATSAEVARSGQQLSAQQSAGQMAVQRSAQQLSATQSVSDAITAARSQDINVLRSNQSAELQQLGMNDEQTRAMAGLAENARIKAQELQLQAEAQGLDGTLAAQQVMNEMYETTYRMFSDQQRQAFQLMAAERGWNIQDRNMLLGAVGGLFEAIAG